MPGSDDAGMLAGTAFVVVVDVGIGTVVVVDVGIGSVVVVDVGAGGVIGGGGVGGGVAPGSGVAWNNQVPVAHHTGWLTDTAKVPG